MKKKPAPEHRIDGVVIDEAAQRILDAADARRLSDKETLRLYQAEMRGEKPLISKKAYS